MDYPVMDLSYETALEYCQWLTVQYNGQNKRRFKKVVFRLPSKREWQMAALGYKDFQSWNWEENTVEASSGYEKVKHNYALSEHEVSYPWFNQFWELRNSIVNNKGCFLANIRTPDEVVCPAGYKGDGFTLPSPVASYFANGLGLYDVIGNVAEMINEKGVAMGGSWNSDAERATLVSEMQFENSDISVGFRLFMEVIEE